MTDLDQCRETRESLQRTCDALIADRDRLAALSHGAQNGRPT